jgi:hypothetical protein
VPRLAGRAAGRGLGHRRPASTRSRGGALDLGEPPSPPESAEQAD